MINLSINLKSHCNAVDIFAEQVIKGGENVKSKCPRVFPDTRVLSM